MYTETFLLNPQGWPYPRENIFQHYLQWQEEGQPQLQAWEADQHIEKSKDALQKIYTTQSFHTPTGWSLHTKIVIFPYQEDSFELV